MAKFAAISQNRDFRRLYHRKGEVSPLLVTYVAKNRLGYNRVGITTSKKIGGAVERNRARRVIREAYRALCPRLKDTNGWDIVFVARSKTCHVKMQAVLKTMEKQLSKYFKEDA